MFYEGRERETNATALPSSLPRVAITDWNNRRYGSVGLQVVDDDDDDQLADFLIITHTRSGDNGGKLIIRYNTDQYYIYIHYSAGTLK